MNIDIDNNRCVCFNCVWIVFGKFVFLEMTKRDIYMLNC